MNDVTWVTSADSYYWDQPRRARVVDVRPGPENGSEYARLEVDADQPDGPMTLLARARHTDAWALPAAGQVLRVLLWTVNDPSEVWTPTGVQPPTPRPSAWCSLTNSEHEARAVANSALPPEESPR